MPTGSEFRAPSDRKQFIRWRAGLRRGAQTGVLGGPRGKGPVFGVTDGEELLAEAVEDGVDAGFRVEKAPEDLGLCRYVVCRFDQFL